MAAASWKDIRVCISRNKELANLQMESFILVLIGHLKPNLSIAKSGGKR